MRLSSTDLPTFIVPGSVEVITAVVVETWKGAAIKPNVDLVEVPIVVELGSVIVIKV